MNTLFFCTHTKASREWMRCIKTAVLTIIKYLMNLNLILCLRTRKWKKKQKEHFSKKFFHKYFISLPLMLIPSRFYHHFIIIFTSMKNYRRRNRASFFLPSVLKSFFLLLTKYPRGGGGGGRKKYDDIGQKQTSRNK